MKFVAGKGEHIHPQRLYIHQDMADSLYRVGMEPRPMRMRNGRQLRNGLDGTDLVIRQHDRDQRGILPDGFFQLGWVDQSICRYRQISDLKALLFQRPGAVQDRVMLKHGGDQMLFSLGRQTAHRPLQRPVIRLGPAGGKIDFTRLGVQGRGDLPAGLFHGTAGGAPDRVDAAGVSVVFHQPGGHRLQYVRSDRSGGGVIGINKAFFHLLFLPFRLNTSICNYIIPNRYNLQ